MRLNSPFPKHVCSVVRSLSETLVNTCKFWIFFFFLPVRRVIIVFVSSVVKIARFFLVSSASVLNIRTSLILINRHGIFPTALYFTAVDLANSGALTPNVYDNGNATDVFIDLVMIIGYFRVPKTITFKMRLGTQPFLWKWVLFVWEWKMISISKAEHLSGPGGTRKWPIWNCSTPWTIWYKSVQELEERWSWLVISIAMSWF